MRAWMICAALALGASACGFVCVVGFGFLLGILDCAISLIVFSCVCFGNVFSRNFALLVKFSIIFI